jgi:hypothetical protein
MDTECLRPVQPGPRATLPGRNAPLLPGAVRVLAAGTRPA